MVKNIFALLTASLLAVSPALALGYTAAIPTPSKLAVTDTGTTGLVALSSTVKQVQFGRPAFLSGIYVSGVVVPIGPCTMTVKKNGVTNLLSTASYDLTSLPTTQSATLNLTTDQSALTLAATDVIQITITCGLVTVTPQGIEVAVEAITQ